MKHTILSLMAVLVMACASAQNNADLLQQDALQMMLTMSKAGIPGPITVGLGDGPAVSGPALSPRTNSGPATRQLANNGGGQQPKKTKIKGVEYFLTPCGPLLPGQICTQNGQDYVVDDYGNLQHIPTQQAPNPANNTGTATASTGTGTATGGGSSDAIVAPVITDDGVLTYNHQTRKWETVPGTVAAANPAVASTGGGSNEDPLLSRKLAPNELTYDRQGNIVRETTGVKKLQVRRGYDDEGNPTEATVAWMNTRNSGGLGRLGGLVNIGVGGGAVGCSGPIVAGGCTTFQGGYNPNPIGWDCWRMQQAQTFGGVWH